MSASEPAPSARQMHERGEHATRVAERLLDESGPADWALPVLRRAADTAARAGDFDRATTMLRRALVSMEPAIDLARVRAVIELGRVEAAAGLDGAERRWETAADQLHELAAHERVLALVDLGEATYSSGLVPVARAHFEAADDLASEGSDLRPVDEETRARILAGLSTTSLLTGRRHPAAAERLEEVIRRPPTHPDLPTRALMASAAGEVALGVDLSAGVVHRLIDAALGPRPLPTSVLRPVFEPLSAALSLTGRPDDSVELLDAQLDRARANSDVVAHVSLLPLRAHAHLLADRLDEACADATEAIELIDAYPSATRLAEAPARYVLSVALVELDDPAGAAAACDVADHRERWGGTPMHGWFLDGVARVHAAAHRHDEAILAWRTAARAFTLVGGSGVICEWRDGLARSLAATGQLAEAEAVAAEQLVAAASFGDPRMSAIAAGTAAAVERDHQVAAERLGEALAALPRSASELTRCRLGAERGARLRREGRRRAARDQLGVSLAVASRLGATRLVRTIRDELVEAGAQPEQIDEPAGYASLTAAERRTAALAASGLGNVEIARRRGVSRKTVESQLSSVYRKLGLSGRDDLETEHPQHPSR